MTKSQRSFLPISQAIITLTHMELSIRPRLLHTGNPTTQQRESGRGSIGKEGGERKSVLHPPLSEGPLAATISSMRRSCFNYSDCAAIPPLTERRETTEEHASFHLRVPPLLCHALCFALFFLFSCQSNLDIRNNNWVVYHTLGRRLRLGTRGKKKTKKTVSMACLSRLA